MCKMTIKCGIEGFNIVCYNANTQENLFFLLTDDAPQFFGMRDEYGTKGKKSDGFGYCKACWRFGGYSFAGYE